MNLLRTSIWLIAPLLFTVFGSATFAFGVGAGDCSSNGGVVDDYVAISIECSQPMSVGSGSGTQGAGGSQSPSFLAYKWVSACTGGPNSDSPVVLDCTRARSCPDSLERLWWLWGLTREGSWAPVYSACFGRPPTILDTPSILPTVTPAVVLSALRKIGLPAVQAKTQPADKTLVNFDTIFYAEPKAFARTLTLLGQRVDIEASPAQFTWRHGDGTITTTREAGAPYPSTDITHQYLEAHQTLHPSVDVAYQARFRVQAGPWQEIPQLVTISGPTTPLRISEATAVLSGEGS